jgi:hypothetical protein
MIIKQMSTTAIQLPFELTHNNIPLQVPEEYGNVSNVLMA